MCVVVRPLVDNAERVLLVEEVKFHRFGVVEGVGFLYEAWLKLVVLAAVHKDCVGNLGRSCIVKRGRFGKQFAAELVDGVCSCLAKAQHLVDFLLRLTCGTIVHHAESKGDAKWREDG